MQNETMRLKRPYVWFAVATLAWPLTSLLLSLARFLSLPRTAWGEAAAFLGMGLVSAAALIGLMNRSRNKTTQISTVVGYLVLCPFAFSGALLSGLNWGVPILGTAVYGGATLAVGSLIGYFLGLRVTEE